MGGGRGGGGWGGGGRKEEEEEMLGSVLYSQGLGGGQGWRDAQ